MDKVSKFVSTKYIIAEDGKTVINTHWIGDTTFEWNSTEARKLGFGEGLPYNHNDHGRRRRGLSALDSGDSSRSEGYTEQRIQNPRYQYSHWRGTYRPREVYLEPPFCKTCGTIGLDRDPNTGVNYIYDLVRESMFQINLMNRYDALFIPNKWKRRVMLKSEWDRIKTLWQPCSSRQMDTATSAGRL